MTKIDKCPICLEELRSNIGAITPCGHCMHRQCFQKLKEDYQSNDKFFNHDHKNNHNQMPPCPVCKQTSNSFVPLYLTFDQKADSTSTSTSTSNSNDENDDSSTNTDSIEESLMAVQSLSSRCFQLQKSLRELQSLSRDQSELLLEVLPKFDTLQTELQQTTEEKDGLNQKIDSLKTTHQHLISAKEQLKLKLDKSHQMNCKLTRRQDKISTKLVKANQKRKRMEDLVQRTAMEQERCRKELKANFMEEAGKLTSLLEQKMDEVHKLNRKVKKLKKKSGDGRKMAKVGKRG